jgi:hypothetical protein
VLARVGEGNLARVTFMRLQGAGNRWAFGGLGRSKGKWVPLPIAGVPASADQILFSNGAIPPSFFNAGFGPVPAGPDSLEPFLTLASRQAATAPDALEGLRRSARIQNPRRHAAGTVDCVSCHVAPATEAYIARAFDPEVPAGWLENFESPGQNLDLTSGAYRFTTTLRALGYVGEEPAISRRVVNESAAVLEQLASY